jgi:hypothetical protein
MRTVGKCILTLLLLLSPGLKSSGLRRFRSYLSFSFLGRGVRGVGVFSLSFLTSSNTLSGDSTLRTGEERGESMREGRGEGFFQQSGGEGSEKEI